MHVDMYPIKTVQTISLNIVTSPDQPLWHRLRLFCCTELRATLLIGGSIDVQQNMYFHL